MTAFGRAYRITVGSIQIDASTGVGANSLRCSFQIERDHKRAPNNCELQIWNLSQGSRTALAKLTVVPVHIEAGYVGDMGTLFLGDLRSARSHKDGAEILTRVSAGDGESKLRTARLSRTFAAGTPVGTVIGALGKALGLAPGNLSAFAGAKLANGSATLKRSLTLSGAVYDDLERLCRSCGLDWSVQNSALQIRDRSQPATGTAAGPLLRADTGLVDQVEVEVATETKDGAVKGQPIVSGVCLLRADLVPGRSFRVEHSDFTGNLVCRSTTHRGDTHDQGGGWVVEWSGIPY